MKCIPHLHINTGFLPYLSNLLKYVCFNFIQTIISAFYNIYEGSSIVADNKEFKAKKSQKESYSALCIFYVLLWYRKIYWQSESGLIQTCSGFCNFWNNFLTSSSTRSACLIIQNQNNKKTKCITPESPNLSGMGLSFFLSHTHTAYNHTCTYITSPFEHNDPIIRKIVE